MGNGNSHRQKYRSKRGGALHANMKHANVNHANMNQANMNQANMNQANAEPTVATAPSEGDEPVVAEPGDMKAVDKKCCPCPDENKEEGFFAKLSPNKLEKKLIETQTNAIEGTQNAFKNGVDNAKAGLSNKITDFLKPAQEGGRRRTRKNRKHKSRKHKRSKHTGSKHKRSKHKRSHTKRKSSRR
jgi:hypothetical protein